MEAPGGHPLGPVPRGGGAAGIGVRFLAYGLALAVAVFALLEVLRGLGTAPFLSEGGLVEWLQHASLLACAGLLASAGRSQHRAAFVALAALPLLALTRELDLLFDQLLFHGAWKIPFGLLALGTGVFAYRRRDELRASLPRFTSGRSFGVLFSAFVLVNAVSRLAGQQAVWAAALGDAYVVDVPRVIEEMLELVGYLLLVVGAVEARLELGAGRAGARRPRAWGSTGTAPGGSGHSGARVSYRRPS